MLCSRCQSPICCFLEMSIAPKRQVSRGEASIPWPGVLLSACTGAATYEGDPSHLSPGSWELLRGNGFIVSHQGEPSAVAPIDASRKKRENLACFEMERVGHRWVRRQGIKATPEACTHAPLSWCVSNTPTDRIPWCVYPSSILPPPCTCRPLFMRIRPIEKWQLTVFAVYSSSARLSCRSECTPL